MSSLPIIVPYPVTPAQLIQDYPEFANSTVYPVSAINYWLSVAMLLVDPVRWQRLVGVGTELFAAHNLVLEAKNLATVNVGGVPGITKGPVSSESAGAVSISYDVQAGIVKDAAHWNLTNYGTRFYKMLRIVGMGPIHLGSGVPASQNGLTTPGIGVINPPFLF